FGLSVHDLFEGEDGCHIAESLTQGRELIRVRVLRALPNASPRALIEEHLEARRNFEIALESVPGRLPHNPDALRPAVRVFRFDHQTPRDAESGHVVEVEDYLLGYGMRATVRSLKELISRLWLLRMSLTPSHADEVRDGIHAP